jgi:hypothetical protein
MNYSFGDIIITHFPFTDGIGKKPRPALVLCDTDDGDITIARITSSIITLLAFTIAIKNLEVAGLYKPSILNFAKPRFCNRLVTKVSNAKKTSV